MPLTVMMMVVIVIVTMIRKVTYNRKVNEFMISSMLSKAAISMMDGKRKELGQALIVYWLVDIECFDKV